MSETPDHHNPFQSNRVAGPYFVGREPELAIFRNSLEALTGRQGVHLYIAGVNGRGKTSCLGKLEELARERGILAVRVNLDQSTSGRDQILSLTETLLDRADEVLEREAKSARLLKEWYKDTGSPFRQRRKEFLNTDALQHDLRYAEKALKGYVKGVLLAVDFGERIMPDALSALTSALEPLPSYLVALAIRMGHDEGNPVRAGRRQLDKLAREAGRHLGASRALGTGVGLGPFSPAQARECIQRRLEGRSISFDEALVNTIVRVSEQLPYAIIDYAHGVYERASLNGSDKATVAEFREVFADMHGEELQETRRLRDSLATWERQTLHELARHDGPVAPLDLARASHPGLPDHGLGALAGGIEGLLDRVSHAAPLYCRKSDGRYEVPGTARRYALEIGMEPE